MDTVYRILTVNPELSATNIGVFDEEVCIFEKTIHHQADELGKFARLWEQAAYREKEILHHLDYEGMNISKLNAVSGRGGLLHPIEGGTYAVEDDMVADLKQNAYGKHVSNLGGLIAYDIGKHLHIPAFVVDPVVVDELEPVARISGLPELPRKSIFHALNQKAVARMAADEMQTKYENTNFIVVHMGFGITIGAHQKGSVIDVNNGLNGEGPFSTTRAGSLPVGDLMNWCLSKGYGINEISEQLFFRSGLRAYLDTDDIEIVETKIEHGDQYAKLIYEAMAYQISKEIGAVSVALCGQVDAIVLTGMLAHQKRLTSFISRRVEWIADTLVYPGEYVMPALAAGALRILKGEEIAKHYKRIREEQYGD